MTRLSPICEAPAVGVAVVADDDEFFRIALATILRTRLGYAAVHETSSLDEALERLAETPEVGLALFDLSMPGMESAASLAAVRECHPQILMAVVSGSTHRQDVLLALQVGVNGFVPKAAGVEELTHALSMIVEGRVYVPAFVAAVAAGTTSFGAIREPLCAGAAAPAADVVLTWRQNQVLGLLVEGLSNKLIARRLGLGEGTVKIHVAALLKALGVPNRAAAAAYGARLSGHGMAPPTDAQAAADPQS